MVNADLCEILLLLYFFMSHTSKDEEVAFKNEDASKRVCVRVVRH